MSKSAKLTIWKEICYAPLGALLWVLSKLPFAILYAVADFIAFIAFRIVGYRRHIVSRNIADCFPEKNEAECRRIEHEFYHCLADYFVETIKLPGMSRKEIHRRMQFENVELIDTLFAEGKDMIIYTSHFGNWEWITSMADWSRTKDAVFSHVYHPLSNAWFDRYFLRLRATYNVSVPMQSVLRRFVEWRRDDRRFITGFLSDQKPFRSTSTYTVDFFNRPTPFIGGTEELARKFNMAVLYFDTTRIRRGFYSSPIRLITRDAAAMSPGEITKTYVNNLETTIRRHPAAYLWSHNRWRLPKRKK